MPTTFLTLALLSAVPFSSGSLAQIDITDDLGRRLRLSSPVERVVSLAPSLTETLFALGAGERVAGVTDYCTYPAAAKAKARVGGVINPSLEAIISLKPDLIVLSMEGNLREDFQKMQSLGIPLFVSNPRTLEDVYRSITQMGTLTGTEKRAEVLVGRMRATAQGVIDAAEGHTKVRVLILVSLQPIMVVGGKNFIHHLLELAGGVNPAAASQTTYPAYNREAVLADNPDLILLMSDIPLSPDGILALYPEWQHLAAARRGRIHQIDADILSRPGPRSAEALERLFTLFHQEQP